MLIHRGKSSPLSLPLCRLRTIEVLVRGRCRSWRTRHRRTWLPEPVWVFRIWEVPVTILNQLWLVPYVLLSRGARWTRLGRGCGTRRGSGILIMRIPHVLIRVVLSSVCVVYHIVVWYDMGVFLRFFGWVEAGNNDLRWRESLWKDLES